MSSFLLMAGVFSDYSCQPFNNGQENNMDTQIKNIIKGMEKPSLRSRFSNRMKRIFPVKK